ncbi:hypothetical protein OROMI_014706 [Orobanche minor]
MELLERRTDNSTRALPAHGWLSSSTGHVAEGCGQPVPGWFAGSGRDVQFLVRILKENKLDGTIFADWKRNLNIILTAEEHKFVRTEECPLEPDTNSTL